MKKVFTIALTSLMVFLFSATKAQDQEILKSFINKNDFVLRSVQKNGIKSQAASFEDVVKSLLKLQLISIAYYDSDKELSKRAANQARLEGLSFLQKNSTVPSKTFQLSEKETKFFSTSPAISNPDSKLEKNEIESIDGMNAKDPSSLDSFITRLK